LSLISRVDLPTRPYSGPEHYIERQAKFISRQLSVIWGHRCGE